MTEEIEHCNLIQKSCTKTLTFHLQAVSCHCCTSWSGSSQMLYHLHLVQPRQQSPHTLSHRDSSRRQSTPHNLYTRGKKNISDICIMPTLPAFHWLAVHKSELQAETESMVSPIHCTFPSYNHILTCRHHFAVFSVQWSNCFRIIVSKGCHKLVIVNFHLSKHVWETKDKKDQWIFHMAKLSLTAV